MRNLKRALSLALALVMVMSMMVVGAGAVSIDDFTDADEIVNTEAVTTMVSLGVIDGNDDGSYNPSGIVKRGEMAKLIAVMLNGGKDPTLGATPVVFADTAGHWAQNYISYVANLHIIDGRGDGTFGPNDDVTGSEAAKMLLTALGYRSDLEGFTGANWAINVQAMANQINLFDGLTINPDEGLTRDNTAQMLYNAVQCDMVEYRNLEGSYDGIVYPQPIDQTGGDSTVLWQRFQVHKVEGVVVANDIMDLDGQGTTTADRVRLTDIDVSGTRRVDSDGDLIDDVYPIGLDNSYLGQRVVLYVKGLRDLAPNASSTEVVGTPIRSEDNTVVTTTQRFADTAAVRTFLTNNNLSIPTDGRTVDHNLYARGTVVYSANDTDISQALNRDFPVGDPANTKGTERTFIDHDGDGVVDYIFETNYTMAKVTAYNESGETLTIAGVGSLDFNEVANPGDVARDDIVLYYKMNDTYYLSVAETVSGEVTTYNDSNKTVTLDDGAAYGKSTADLHNASTDLEEFLNNSDLEEFIGNTYTFYLDNDGNVVGWVLGEGSVGNYAIILASEGTPSANMLSTGKVKLLLADGSEGIYDVDLLASANRLGGYNGSNSVKENALATDLQAGNLDNRIVTYVIDGSEVIISDPTHVASRTYSSVADNAGATNRSNNKQVSRAQAEYTFNAGTANETVVTVNDNTIFFINNGNDDATVVVGLSNMPADAIDSVDNTLDDDNGMVKSAIYTTTSANERIARAVWVDGYYGGSTNFVYVKEAYSASRPNTSGEIIYTYSVVFENGESGTLQVRGNVLETGGPIEDGSIYEYVMNGNYAELSATDETINGVVSTWSNGLSIRVKNGSGADNGAAATEASYGIATDANLWNVEGDSAINETLTANMDVVLGLRDGVVDVAFVKDTNTEFRTVTNRAAGAFDVNGVTLGVNESLLVAYGYDVEVTDTTGTAQSVTYDVNYENTNADRTGVVDPDGTFSMPSEATVTITAVTGVLAGSAAPTITAGADATPVTLDLSATTGTIEIAKVEATPANGGTLTYQWYLSDGTALADGADYSGVTTNTLSLKLDGTVADSLRDGTTPPIGVYCVVTNTETGKNGATAASGTFTVSHAEVVRITLTNPSDWTGYKFYNGTDAAANNITPEPVSDLINGDTLTLEIPAGSAMLLIQNDSWTAGDQYTFMGGSYTVNPGKTIQLNDLTVLEGVASISVSDFVRTGTQGEMAADDVGNILEAEDEASVGSLTGSANISLGSGKTLTLTDIDQSSYTGTITAGEGSTLNLPANPEDLNTAVTIEAGATVNVDGQPLIGENAPLSLSGSDSLEIAVKDEYGVSDYTVTGTLTVNENVTLNNISLESGTVAIPAGVTLTLNSDGNGAAVYSTVEAEVGARIAFVGDSATMDVYNTYQHDVKWDATEGGYKMTINDGGYKQVVIPVEDPTAYAPEGSAQINTTYEYRENQEVGDSWTGNADDGYSMTTTTASGWFEVTE